MAFYENIKDYGETPNHLSTPFWDKICLLQNEYSSGFVGLSKNQYEIS